MSWMPQAQPSTSTGSASQLFIGPQTGMQAMTDAEPGLVSHCSASTTIDVVLPPLTVPCAMYLETLRQVGLQLEALNGLTGDEWLFNVVMNRLKTPENQVNSSGPKSGVLLAQKIDKLLGDADFAKWLMHRIVSHMADLKNTTSDVKLQAHLDKIATAAAAAASAKQIYQEFRDLKGLLMLDILRAAELEGGVGRQKGEGDEKWFRKTFEQVIEWIVAVNPLVLTQNACLHNPDQCAGGYLQIIWSEDEVEQIEWAMQWHANASVSHAEAKREHDREEWLLASYQINPPKLNGLPDTARIAQQQAIVDKLEEQLSIHEDELEQAASTLLHLIGRHVGNGEVNGFLGTSWMEEVKGAINRVDLMLDAVMSRFPAGLAAKLNVSMPVECKDTVLLHQHQSYALGQFPDLETLRLQSKPASNRGRKPRTEGEKLERGKQKQHKPQQQTLQDLFYRNAKKKKQMDEERKDDDDETDMEEG